MYEQGSGIIETRSLAEQVYLYLSDSIIRGRYNYGETINTKQLTSELKVSMMPIREALKRLELEGIIEVRPRSMCVITTPTRETINSAIAVRELLETYCVKNAYDSVSLEQLKPLRAITEDMERALVIRNVAFRPTVSRGYGASSSSMLEELPRIEDTRPIPFRAGPGRCQP